jgi:hypothetical protein
MSRAELILKLYRQIDVLNYVQLLKLKAEIDLIIQSQSATKK